MSANHDVLIVGGGLAGAALALALQQGGRKVALVEPQSFDASSPGRIIAISRGTALFLQSLGVWQPQAGNGAAIERILVCQQGGKARVAMDCRKANEPALGYVVASNPLLTAIYQKLTIQQFCPGRLTTLHRHGQAIEAEISSAGQTERLAARLVVGADGTSSLVRSLAGIETSGWDHNRFGIVADVLTAKPHDGLAIECFRADGPLAFLPLDARRVSIVWTVGPTRASQLLRLTDQEFLAELAREGGHLVADKLGAMLSCGPRQSYPFELRQARTITAPRIALIGNAAHTIHPVGGQGLNLGMRDVALLAELLNNNPRDAGDSVLLETWRQQRLPDHLAVIALTEGVNALFALPGTVSLLGRELGLQGLQLIPPLKNRLIRHAAGLAFFREVRP